MRRVNSTIMKGSANKCWLPIKDSLESETWVKWRNGQLALKKTSQAWNARPFTLEGWWETVLAGQKEEISTSASVLHSVASPFHHVYGKKICKNSTSLLLLGISCDAPCRLTLIRFTSLESFSLFFFFLINNFITGIRDCHQSCFRCLSKSQESVSFFHFYTWRNTNWGAALQEKLAGSLLSHRLKEQMK